MKPLYGIFMIVFTVLIFSCEDVIELDLNTTEPKLVIEGRLYDQFFPATVILTRTTDFFDTLSIHTVSDAEVKITDPLGNSIQLIENDSTPGLYQADFFGETGRPYTLSVICDGQTYTSTAEMKPSLFIDSVKAVYHSDEIPYFQEGYELRCYISDTPGINEYCMLNVYKNFKKSYQIYLYEDTYTEGLSFEYRFYGDNFMPGDTCIIEMLTCDRSVYDYLYTYSEIASDYFQDSGTPYNPTSNISNGALGFFGVFSLNGSLLIVQ
jgi:hypothetical protein